MCSTGQDRTLVIPSGTLDGNVTNVVVIPNELQCTGQSLVVRAPAANRSLPIHGERGFDRQQPRRYATSLDGTPGYVRQPDLYEEEFNNPIAASTFQSYVDDDYYFDMYDSSQDRFVGGSSGDLSGSALQAILGGGMNRISGAEQPAQGGGCPCKAQQSSVSPAASAHSGYVGPQAQTSATSSHYTPLSVPQASYSGVSGSDSDYVPPEPNCGPCFPGSGGNPDLCPDTCPMKRGIAYGDPNITGDYLPSFEEPAPPCACSPAAANRTGPAPNRTVNLNRPAPSGANRTMNIAAPGAVLNRTVDVNRPAPSSLNRGMIIDEQGAGPNRTRDLNRPAPSAPNRTMNITGPGACLNRTRDLNRQAPSAPNRTMNIAGPSANPNRTRNLNRPAPSAPSRTMNITGPGACLNRTRDINRPAPSAPNRTMNITGPGLNRTMALPAPTALNRTMARPGPAANRPGPTPDLNTTGTFNTTDSQVNINITFASVNPVATSTPTRPGGGRPQSRSPPSSPCPCSQSFAPERTY